MKSKIKQAYWVAFIISSNKDKNKLLTSFLSFWAYNRYYARKAIESMLEENDSYLDENGLLRQFSILELHQCKPEDSNTYAEIYTRKFAEMVGVELSQEDFIF